MPSLYDYIGKLRKCDHTTQVVHIPLCPVSAQVTYGRGTFADISGEHLPAVADVYSMLDTPVFHKSIKRCLQVSRVEWHTKFQMRKPDQLLLCAHKVASKPGQCVDGMLTLHIMRTADNVAVVTAHICDEYSAPPDNK